MRTHKSSQHLAGTRDKLAMCCSPVIPEFANGMLEYQEFMAKGWKDISAALAEDLSLVPSIHVAVVTVYHSVPRHSVSSSGL